MGKKASTVAGRAWRLLRLPLDWSKKSLGDDSHVLKTETYRRHYNEREFSFDDTPSYQFKATRRSASICLLPCITPSVDFDDDDEDEDKIFFQKSGNMKYVELGDSDEDHASVVDEDEGSVQEGAEDQIELKTQSGIQLPSAKFSKNFSSAKLSKNTALPNGPEISFKDTKYVDESDEDYLHTVDEEEDWDSMTTWSDAMPEGGDEEDEEIDSRAEKFISEFYEKIKLQRHSSPLARAS